MSLAITGGVRHDEGQPREGSDGMVTRTISPRIVVCDDEARLATLTAQLLEAHGFQAVATTSIAAARRELMRAHVAAVVLDVNLPGDCPSDLLDFIVERGEDTRVLVTSGFGEDDVPPEILAHPQVTGYIAKPYSVDAIARRLDEMLDS